MLKITKIISIIIVALFSLSLLTNVPAFAANSDICNNSHVSDEVKAAAGCPGKSTAKLSDVIASILNGVIGFLGIVAVIFIIVGGINYTTSLGDPGKIQKAKNTILYACIGLIICALAFAIVNFAINIINNSGKENSEDDTTETTSLIKNDIAFLDKKL